MLEGLLAGPQDEGLVSLLPQDVELRGVRVDDEVCYVDFSGVLLDHVPESQEEQRLVVYSIVNSLCSLDTVEKGQLTQYGSIPTGEPLAADSTLTG